MRVFSIAQRLGQWAAYRTPSWRGIGQLLREPVRDCCVVSGSARISLSGKFLAQGPSRALVLLQLRDDRGIVLRIYNDSDVMMVFRRRADHRGAADIDVLDAGLEIGALHHCLFERIEIHYEQIDRLD